jgi:hypothetical protein
MRYLPHSVITIDHRDDEALFQQLLSQNQSFLVWFGFAVSI